MKSRILVLFFFMVLIYPFLYSQVNISSDNFKIIDTVFLRVDDHINWDRNFNRCDSLNYKRFFIDTRIDYILRSPEQEQYLENDPKIPVAYYYSLHHISDNYTTVGIVKIQGFTELYLFNIDRTGRILDYALVSKDMWLWTKTTNSESLFRSQDSLMTLETTSLKDTVVYSHKFYKNGSITTKIIYETYMHPVIPGYVSDLFRYKNLRVFDLESEPFTNYNDSLFNKAVDPIFKLISESTTDYFPSGDINLAVYNELPYNRKLFCFSNYLEASGIGVRCYLFNKNDRLIGSFIGTMGWGDQGDWGIGKGMFINDSTYSYNYLTGYYRWDDKYVEEKIDEKYVFTRSDTIYKYQTKEILKIEEMNQR